MIVQLHITLLHSIENQIISTYFEVSQKAILQIVVYNLRQTVKDAKTISMCQFINFYSFWITLNPGLDMASNSARKGKNPIVLPVMRFFLL